MNKACIFFKVSDLVMHYPRNYQKYPDITVEKNYVFDESIGNYGKADLYYKEGAASYPVIVNVHGGGFVKGDKRHRQAISAEYARLGWFVYNVNYRLSPQYPLPYAGIDVVNAINKLPEIAEKYKLDLNKIVITGDSAGGFHSASAVLACVNPEYAKLLGIEQPKLKPIAYMGFCGAYRLGDILAKKTPLNVADDIAAALMGVKCGTHVKVETCERYKFSDLIPYVNSDFPESFLVSSTHDAFCGGQTELLANALKSNGVPCKEFIASGEKDGHCFHLLLKHKTRPACMEQVKAFLSSI